MHASRDLIGYEPKTLPLNLPLIPWTCLWSFWTNHVSPFPLVEPLYPSSSSLPLLFIAYLCLGFWVEVNSASGLIAKRLFSPLIWNIYEDWRFLYLGFPFCLISFSPKGLSQEDRIIIIIFYLVKSLLVDISRCSFSSFDLISGLVSGRDLDSYLILWSSAQPERLALYLVHFGLWVSCFTFIWPRFSSPSSQAKKNVFYEPDARSRRPAIIFPWIKWRSCYQRCYEA